ncbi:SOS response-associated peptidase [Halobellus clavatus]|jgi:putative SOS response-associated peptidase YedK|uniref:Putative SOS response-associated peptidase YedK n=1 Tax=Halobellus clavatus TaxID=660517 RepID=A0A1H3FBE6_9EURY|nr:SOS response-associated peptidase [Halobellus clavatus]SDX87469.1 Putative SOS response-associated peptidase YedK [Halobellus clavatus]
MCGRYTLFTPTEELEARFDAEFPGSRTPRYNCAPGQALPVIRNDAPDTFQRLQWGLVPSWADDERAGNDRINARAETIDEKASFADAYERRRCLVPADGFYEWVQRDETKQPYRVAFQDDRPFAMAGIWERWESDHAQTGLGDFGGDGGADADPEVVESFAVVTTDPNDVVADLHHRMAVVLDPEEESTWLQGSTEEAARLLDPYPAEAWDAYPVSTRVNSPGNDDPGLVDPIEAE